VLSLRSDLGNKQPSQVMNVFRGVYNAILFELFVACLILAFWH
jgi:hypothetical protein